MDDLHLHSPDTDLNAIDSYYQNAQITPEPSQLDEPTSSSVVFDFQRRQEDREFFQESLGAHLPSSPSLGQKRLRKRKKVVYDANLDEYIVVDDETPHEREERLQDQKRRKLIHRRFTSLKKYDLKEEVDYGDSVNHMIRAKMLNKGLQDSCPNLNLVEDDEETCIHGKSSKKQGYDLLYDLKNEKRSMQ